MIKYICSILFALLLVGCSATATVETSPPPLNVTLKVTEPLVYYAEPVETDCGITEDTYNAFYCPMDNTIYFGVELKDSLTYAQYVMVLAHEGAHADDTQQDWEVFPNEQFADCTAGQQMRKMYDGQMLDDQDITEVYDWFMGHAANDHGTPAQRWGAYYDGFTGGDCYAYHRH